MWGHVCIRFEETAVLYPFLRFLPFLDPSIFSDMLHHLTVSSPSRLFHCSKLKAWWKLMQFHILVPFFPGSVVFFLLKSLFFCFVFSACWSPELPAWCLGFCHDAWMLLWFSWMWVHVSWACRPMLRYTVALRCSIYVRKIICSSCSCQVFNKSKSLCIQS